MAYVTSSNFEELLPVIEKSIKEASFISFDTEFTGLYTTPDLKPSLFDTIDKRYLKLYSSVTQFAPCQFGLTVFCNEKEENKYRAQTFVFYIRSHSICSIDHCFSFQTSCLQFLCDHEFNFNKFAFESIPYLNEEEEKQLKTDLSNQLQPLFRNINEDALQDQCSSISSWLTTAQEGDEFELKKHKEIQDFICINELNQKFESIRAIVKDEDTIIVKKITPKEKTELKNQVKQDDNETLHHFLGFTKVFRMLVDAKKNVMVQATKLSTNSLA
ncbi:poly(A)-specific ribonuclease PNLDC1-like [Centruroides vittatus]|uniref:poly(A)-specific ribonuclease PNLDC1-like n=1 Tax=Centruroides vittatus TaxID=120091 RepID=UPI00350F19B0